MKKITNGWLNMILRHALDAEIELRNGGDPLLILHNLQTYIEDKIAARNGLIDEDAQKRKKTKELLVKKFIKENKS